MVEPDITSSSVTYVTEKGNTSILQERSRCTIFSLCPYDSLIGFRSTFDPFFCLGEVQSHKVRKQRNKRYLTAMTSGAACQRATWPWCLLTGGHLQLLQLPSRSRSCPCHVIWMFPSENSKCFISWQKKSTKKVFFNRCPSRWRSCPWYVKRCSQAGGRQGGGEGGLGC